MRKNFLRLLFCLFFLGVASTSLAGMGSPTFNDSPDFTTTDNGTYARDVWYIDEDSTGIINIEAIAVAEDGTSAYWNLTLMIKRVGTGDATIVGSIVNTVSPIKNTGALLWTFTISMTDDYVQPVVHGASGTTIYWYWQGNTAGLHHTQP